jgi:hypothetical protein
MWHQSLVIKPRTDVPRNCSIQPGALLGGWYGGSVVMQERPTTHDLTPIGSEVQLWADGDSGNPPWERVVASWRAKLKNLRGSPFLRYRVCCLLKLLRQS